MKVHSANRVSCMTDVHDLCLCVYFSVQFSLQNSRFLNFLWMCGSRTDRTVCRLIPIDLPTPHEHVFDIKADSSNLFMHRFWFLRDFLELTMELRWITVYCLMHCQQYVLLTYCSEITWLLFCSDFDCYGNRYVTGLNNVSFDIMQYISLLFAYCSLAVWCLYFHSTQPQQRLSMLFSFQPSTARSSIFYSIQTSCETFSTRTANCRISSMCEFYAVNCWGWAECVHISRVSSTLSSATRNDVLYVRLTHSTMPSYSNDVWICFHCHFLRREHFPEL